MIESIQTWFETPLSRKIVSSVLFVVTIVALCLIYQFAYNKLAKHVQKTKTVVDDFVADLLRLPILVILCWITFTIFSAYSFIAQTTFYPTLTKINNILFIAGAGWLLTKLVKIMFYYFEHKLNMRTSNNYAARKDMTKMKIFEGILVALIAVVTIAICLMTFDKVRTIGLSLLTSAGIAGIIGGLAAQKSIASIFAGIQIAITQPIRLDDQVFPELDT